MDVFMGVVSYHAQKCYEHKINPDVDELERYNLQAKKRECLHKRQSQISMDDYEYNICVDCQETRNLPVPEVLNGKPFNVNRSWR